MSSEAKSSAGIIGVLPVFVTGAIYFTTPDYIALLFTTSAGQHHPRGVRLLDADGHPRHAQNDQLRFLKAVPVDLSVISDNQDLLVAVMAALSASSALIVVFWPYLAPDTLGNRMRVMVTERDRIRLRERKPDERRRQEQEVAVAAARAEEAVPADRRPLQPRQGRRGRRDGEDAAHGRLSRPRARW
jgi:hypothetical protein